MDESSYNNHFTLSNIPYGVVSTPDNPSHRLATRLYDRVFILPLLLDKGYLTDLDKQTKDSIDQPNLNALAALPRTSQTHLRHRLQDVLRKHLEDDSGPGHKVHDCSYPAKDIQYHLPVQTKDFTDFSCSIDHVLNAGEAATGVRRLPAGFLHYPVGYGGRSSSIVVSGAEIRRPWGQYRDRGSSQSQKGEVVFGPSQRVDFELEVACVVGRSTRLGEQVSVNEADEHIFGFVLLNDWSARDIQGLEMDPLGPLNGKSFGTTISPWVVTIDALRPFQVASTTARQLPNATYLEDKNPSSNSYAVDLQVEIITAGGEGPSTTTVACRSKLQWLYWTFRDMLAHQTVNGCPLSTGDLVATGTISGSEDGTLGCLLEITRGGKKALRLAEDGQGDATERMWLHDGDAVRLTGWAGEIGSEQCVGFGECIGTLAAAWDRCR